MGNRGSNPEGDRAAAFERACKVGDAVSVADAVGADAAALGGTSTQDGDTFSTANDESKRMNLELPRWLTKDLADACLLRNTGNEVRLDIVALLLSHCGADMDAVNVYGNTACHNCVFLKRTPSPLILAERLRVLSYLLHRGARTDLKNRDGLTPLALACVEENRAAASALARAGASMWDLHEWVKASPEHQSVWLAGAVLCRHAFGNDDFLNRLQARIMALFGKESDARLSRRQMHAFLGAFARVSVHARTDSGSHARQQSSEVQSMNNSEHSVASEFGDERREHQKSMSAEEIWDRYGINLDADSDDATYGWSDLSPLVRDFYGEIWNYSRPDGVPYTRVRERVRLSARSSFASTRSSRSPKPLEVGSTPSLHSADSSRVPSPVMESGADGHPDDAKDQSTGGLGSSADTDGAAVEATGLSETKKDKEEVHDEAGLPDRRSRRRSTAAQRKAERAARRGAWRASREDGASTSTPQPPVKYGSLDTDGESDVESNGPAPATTESTAHAADTETPLSSHAAAPPPTISESVKHESPARRRARRRRIARIMRRRRNRGGVKRVHMTLETIPEDVETFQVESWHVKPGDFVMRDDLLVSVSDTSNGSGAGSHDIRSQTDGVVQRLNVVAGEAGDRHTSMMEVEIPSSDRREASVVRIQAAWRAALARREVRLLVRELRGVTRRVSRHGRSLKELLEYSKSRSRRSSAHSSSTDSTTSRDGETESPVTPAEAMASYRERRRSRNATRRVLSSGYGQFGHARRVRPRPHSGFRDSSGAGSVRAKDGVVAVGDRKPASSTGVFNKERHQTAEERHRDRMRRQPREEADTKRDEADKQAARAERRKRQLAGLTRRRRRQQQAAVIAQRLARVWLSRRRIAGHHVGAGHSSAAVQSLYRGTAITRITERSEERLAASRIQAVVRGNRGRAQAALVRDEAWRTDREERRHAAVALQGLYRAVKARRTLAVLQERVRLYCSEDGRRGAVALQRLARGWTARRRVQRMISATR